MALPECRKFQVMVPHYEQRPTEDGTGTREHYIGKRPAEVIVAIDWEKIAETLGARAYISKGGRSREINGLVEVNHIRTRRK